MAKHLILKHEEFKQNSFLKRPCL